MKRKYALLIMAVILHIACCKKPDTFTAYGSSTLKTKALQSNFLQTPVIYTLAGNGTADFTDGASAMFNQPAGIAVDVAGNVYVADQANNRIRKITAAGVASTLAGNGQADMRDTTVGTAAMFNAPSGLAIDAAGNVLVADKGNHRIRKITQAGVVTTVAGSDSGYAEGPSLGTAKFFAPSAVAIDADGNIYVADTKNYRIRLITATAPSQVVTLMGTGTQGPDDGDVSTARFNKPVGIALDAAGNIYVADSNRIRKISAGLLTTLAGSETAGFAEGSGAAARFNGPTGIAIDATGNIYVADRGNNRIRLVTATGTVSTLVGANADFMDGAASIARLRLPAGITIGIAGTIYIADQGNHRLREFALARIGRVSTLAGNGNAGFADAQGGNARFSSPAGTAADDSGNVYVADRVNHRIRKISSTGIVTTIAGSGVQGFEDGSASMAKFNWPTDVAVDATTGNLYVTDEGNHRIRKITPAGMVSTLAGNGTSGSTDGNGTIAQFNFPWGIDVDSHGNVFVCDQENYRIRKITPSGVVSTFAGGVRGHADGTGTLARFNTVTGIAIDKADNIYVAQFHGGRVRKISPAGEVSTFAGSGFDGHVDGIGIHAQFSAMYSIAVDGYGNVYVGDYGNNVIRTISPSGIVTTLAGDGQLGFADGTGTQAEFYLPIGIGADASGNIYVGDNSNHRIRKIQ